MKQTKVASDLRDKNEFEDSPVVRSLTELRRVEHSAIYLNRNETRIRMALQRAASEAFVMRFGVGDE